MQENKVIQIGKEEVKLFIFRYDMILYLENHKESTKNLLKLINKFIKVAGYKIQIKNQMCFYTLARNTTKPEFNNRIPFITASKRIKYLGIQLIKKV